MARDCFLKPDDIVFFVVLGVYVHVISSLCFYIIGWHWICVIQLVRSGTLAGGVAMTQDDVIYLTTLSRLGGLDHSQCSDGLLIALQWAVLTALPMSVFGHTVVTSREGEVVYKACLRLVRSIHDWVTALRRSSMSPSHSKQLWSCAGLTTYFGGGVALG